MRSSRRNRDKRAASFAALPKARSAAIREKIDGTSFAYSLFGSGYAGLG